MMSQQKHIETDPRPAGDPARKAELVRVLRESRSPRDAADSAWMVAGAVAFLVAVCALVIVLVGA
jgi:type IV secretory pathway component VirB8